MSNRNITVLNRVAAALSGRPLALEPYAFKSMLDGIMPRISGMGDVLADDDYEGPDDGLTPEQRRAKRRRSALSERLSTIVEAEVVALEDISEYALTPEGVAIITVTGSLVSRWDWLSALCGFTSYDSLAYTIHGAAEDARVKGILVDSDSPGGEAAGMLDCADEVRAVAKEKAVWFSANPMAASAMYAVAAGGSRILLPRLACVGSIGVVAVHVDQSEYDKENGFKYTPLYSGARKVDGWSHAPLTSAALKRIQSQLDEARRKFAESVAKHRDLSIDAVLETEAAVYDDEEAVSVGLADAVQPFTETLAEMAEAALKGSDMTLKRGKVPAKGGKAPKNAPKKGATQDPDPTETEVEAEEETEAEAESEESESGEEGDDTESADEAGEDDGEAAPKKAAPKAAAKGKVMISAETASKIVSLCAEAGAPSMASALIASGATIAQTKERLKSVATIRALVEKAGKVNSKITSALADDYIKQGASVEFVRAALFDSMTGGQSPEFRATTDPATNANGKRSQAEIDQSWATAIDSTFGKQSKKE